jgi:23S rRNA (cytidine2498-2'-O)-methyltransferase
VNELQRSPFLVTGCAPGVEAWLKAELARVHPPLRSGFARPGLVTWKRGDGAPSAAEVRTVFAAVVAESLGEASGPGDIADQVRALLDRDAGPLRLHVHGGAPRPRDARMGSLAPEARERLVQQHTFDERVAIVAALGEDARRLAPGELPSEPSWLGLHRHAPPRQPWPSGRSPVEVPTDAPSRAWAKMEEALLWSRAPVRAGDLAVEIGSAPGGASMALLRRGLDVIGIDPGEMDARVLAFATRPRFSHLRAPIRALKKSDLPADVAWVAVDLNVAPPLALRYLERVVGPRLERLHGVILNLRLSDAAMAARVPALISRVQQLGFLAPMATQLPSNRREICVVALTERGARRREQQPRPPVADDRAPP